MYFALMGLALTQDSWLERSDTVAHAKIDTAVSFLHGYAQNIFTRGQTVAIDMGDKTLIHSLILPDSYRSTTPKVTKAVLHDTTHHLVLQSLCLWIGFRIASLMVIEIKPLIGSYQHLMLMVLIQGSH